MDHLNGKTPLDTATTTETRASSPRTSTPGLDAGTNGNNTALLSEDATIVDEIEESKKGRFAYFKTKNFYIVLALGYRILPRITPSHFS